jgi:2-dehydro-3-deoxyphosphogluconate aldolase/(4S)-4-hydroxy-2-oxoglutarate aldolase
MNKTLEELGKIGIVPVIKIDDPDKAVPLAKALIAGGIPCAEVTFRTAQGEEAIKRIHKDCPDMLLGAGTVLTIEQVDKAVAAGAQFIVSPGFNPKIVKHCLDKGVAVTPGTSCPSDIEQALDFGLDVVKVFPAEVLGGLDYIKAVSGPFPNLKFMPTGGINAGNIAAYIKNPKIHACGGSWMVKSDLIKAGNFAQVTALCKEAVQTMLGFSVIHMGINANGNDDAQNIAASFAKLFSFVPNDGAASVFAGPQIEIMKNNGRGAHGHIGIGTNSVEKAVAYLGRMGVGFIKESTTYNDDGSMKLVYLKDPIGGFAIHLVKRA